jgi:hypothetical protein
MNHSFRSFIPMSFALLIVLAIPCRLWAFAAVGGFAAASIYADSDDSQSPTLIVTADFNRDGIADVAQIVRTDGVRTGPGFLQILFGQKNGSYRSDVHLAMLKSDPQSMVAGDFNGDGNPDLLIGGGDGSVTELLGDGKGNLMPAVVVAHVGSAVSIAVGDFNRDGVPDIAVSDFRANAVTILLGSGKGAFTTKWSFALPKRGTVYYLAAGDFNYDGAPDLAITSDEDGMFVVMLGNGNGTFTYAPELSHIRDPRSYCPT